MTNYAAGSLHARFDDFVDGSREALTLLERHLGQDAVRTAVAESRHAVPIVEPYLAGRNRILEVGSGLGLLSGFLGSLGYDVTALEPGGIGYEERSILADLVPSDSSVDYRSSAIEDLDPSVEVPFDLIFSINVLEHVEDVHSALSAMKMLLDNDGVMVHECPNYTVPFEPHFGVPLVPFAPSRSRSILPSSIINTGLWASLNFITARDVRRSADQLGLSADFEPALLARSLDRLNDDPEFRQRHQWLGKVAAGLQRLGITKALSQLPAGAATPMIFRLQQT